MGLTINNKLKFSTHIDNICKVANRKLSALSRVHSYMNRNQISIVTSAFIKSQFSYCPLIWMFSSKKSLNRIDNIHERSMRLITQDFVSEFDSLLRQCNEQSIQQICLNFLMTEVYKYLNGLSPEIMDDVFKIRQSNYDLRNFSVFQSQNPRSNRYGLDAIAYRASQLWQMLPSDIKNAPTIYIFKKKIKVWVCTSCPCLFCKRYIQHLGYV